MIPANLKKIAHWVGSVLAIVSLYFIASRIFNHVQLIELKGILSVKNVAFIAMLSFAYMLNLIFLVLAWRHLILAEGGALDTQAALVLYGKSQIAKYLPGNVFHFAGRQVLGHLHGLAQAVLLKASLWEVLLITVAAILIGLIALANLVTSFSMMILIALAVVVGVAYFLTEYFKPGYVKAFYAYLIFHIVAGLLFIAVLNITQDNIFAQATSLAVVLSAYVLAWLVGFVTPGVPGGIGVREVTILFLLGNSYPEQAILLALVISRMVTTLGDVCLFLLAITQKENKHKLVQPST